MCKEPVFLTHRKLRKNCTDMKLEIHFDLPKSGVGKIYTILNKFVVNYWSKPRSKLDLRCSFTCLSVSKKKYSHNSRNDRCRKK